MSDTAPREADAMARLAVVLVVVLALGVVDAAHARSPLVGQLNAAATRYHEDPARLDMLRAGPEQAMRDDHGPPNFTALSRVCFIWGTSARRPTTTSWRPTSAGARPARAVELGPRAFPGHLWYTINTARWGQTKGVVRSLFLLPTVREEIRVLLELAPDPGPLGGDIDRAETEFRRKDPSSLADWTVKDVPDARRLLGVIRDR